MHYKKVAAALRIIQRAKGNVEKAMCKVAEDVARYPDKYTMEEKIRLWQYLSKNYHSRLRSLALSKDVLKELEKYLDQTPKKS